MNKKVTRIAIIGPESSGKSELCEKLAAHYDTVWVKEYARSYLPQLNNPYTLQDIVYIYAAQFEKEQQLLKEAKRKIFIDTEFIIAKVWCENAFQKSPEYIDHMIQKHQYDLYLLTSPDLPWEFDNLRENPGKGEYFFEWYKKLLEAYAFPYRVVSGTGEQRTQCAIDAIESFCKANS